MLGDEWTTFPLDPEPVPVLEVVGVSRGAVTSRGEELLVAATCGGMDGGVLFVFVGVKDAIALGPPTCQ